MSIEFMGDPYEAQLRAAKAEGELARIKDALREFAEENGFNPEMEPRDLLAKAAGAFRSCAAMSDARYTEIRELKAEMEAMRPRLMPEGMSWPAFEDGEPVRIGDEYVDTFGADTVAIIEFGDGYSAINPNTSGGYVVGKFKGAHGRYVPRPAPKVLDADGVEIRVGDTVYHVKDGSEMTVYGIEGEWLVVSVGGRVRHDIVTHRAPVIAADGKPLEVGQTVWEVDGTGHPFKVVSIRTSAGRAMEQTVVTCDVGDGTSEHFLPSQLTHQRPVLDADGVEVHKGDEVWSTTGEFDGKRTVSSVHIDPDEPPYATFEERQKPYSCLCCYLIHRAPVLAADGEPLEVGQTVWNVNNGMEFTVSRLPKPGEYQAVEVRYRNSSSTSFDPDRLTHQRPVLDEDGVLCREGDEVWEVRSHRRREIVGTNYCDHRTGEPLILCDGDDAIPIPATCVTHAKPEPPDSRRAIVNEIGDEMAARIDLLVSSGRWSDAN